MVVWPFFWILSEIFFQYYSTRYQVCVFATLSLTSGMIWFDGIFFFKFYLVKNGLNIV